MIRQGKYREGMMRGARMESLSQSPSPAPESPRRTGIAWLRGCLWAVCAAGLVAFLVRLSQGDRHFYWLYDFDIFWRAGRELLAGVSPYRVRGFFSPLPLAVLFAPLALLPLRVAYAVFVLLTLWMLWKARRGRVGWALLCFPVLFTLFVGQVDLTLALAASLLGPLALPLLLAKPQVAFVTVPWMLRHGGWRRLAVGIAAAAVLLLLCFWLRPGWLARWRAAVPAEQDYAAHDSNLYRLVPPRVQETLVWVISPVVLAAGVWLRSRRDSWAVLHLFTPITNVYSAAVLAEWIGPLEVVLSWAAFLLVRAHVHHGAPMYLVALAILARRAPDPGSTAPARAWPRWLRARRRDG